MTKTKYAFFAGLAACALLAGVGAGAAIHNLAAAPTVTRADNDPVVITFTAGTDTGSTSVTKGGITIAGSNLSRTDNYRAFVNSDLTISGASMCITKIVITCTGSGTANYGPGKFSLNEGGGEYSYSGKTGTWTGDSVSVTLHASAQVRMTKIEVTAYEDTATHIQLSAEDAVVERDDGEFKPVVMEGDEVAEGYTLAPEDENVLQVGADGDTLIPVNFGATRVKITKTSADPSIVYDDSYFTVIVTRKCSIGEIVTDLLAGTLPNTEYRTFQGTVTGVYGSSYMVQQNGYGMYVYNKACGAKVGDVIRATAKFQKYNGWCETNGVSEIEVVEGATPETITPLVLEDPADLTDDKQNVVLTFKNLTYVSGTYTVGTNANIVFKTEDGANVTYRTDKYVDDDVEAALKTKIEEVIAQKDTSTVNLVGVHYTVYNTDKQFKIDNASRIQIVSKTATDEEIVQGFVDDYLHFTDIPDTEENAKRATDACSKAGGYYEIAKAALNALSSEQILLFQTGEAFAAARARYESWAEIYGDSTPYASTYSTSARVASPVLGEKTTAAIVVLGSIALVAAAAVGLCIYRAKRKENN